MKAFAAGSIVLALQLCALVSMALAQDTAPASQNLGDLSQHPNLWPQQVTLKNDVRLVIELNGKQVGAITSPAGSTVSVISITPTALQIGVASARGEVDPAQTDLWQRVATAPSPPATPNAAASTSPAVNSPTPPVAPAPPSPSTPSAAATPPPKIPAPETTGAPLLFDTEIPPRDNFTKAAFRFWSPAYRQPIRGVIVMVPGLRGDGRNQLRDPAWQALATKYRLALVACFLQGPGSYYEAPRGTGDALLAALGDFAKQSNHAEVATAPLLLYGESAGGQFNYDFVLWKPERVVAFVVNKGGYYDGGEQEHATRAIPGLFFLGLKDSALRIQAITGIWTEGRQAGALWALAPQPNSGHEFSRTGALARVFFDSVLALRLPDDAATFDGSAKPIEEGDGWTGDLTTHEIQAVAPGAEPDRKAAWLPDESSAKAWRQFVAGP